MHPESRIRLVTALCLLGAGCDVLKEQYHVASLRAKVAHHFTLDSLALALSPHRALVVALVDSARAARQPDGRFAFAESLAVFAAETYRGPHIASVIVAFTKRTPRIGRFGVKFDSPIIFIPEYHPDGRIRMATLQRPQSHSEREDSSRQ
jgi:hypothetical protein